MLKTMLLIGLLSTSASAEWTKQDTYLQLTYTALHVIDWGQTRYIVQSDEYYEKDNSILDKTPSLSEVDTYFAITLLLHTYVSCKLKQPYRKYWQYIAVFNESHFVYHNYALGIQVQF